MQWLSIKMMRISTGFTFFLLCDWFSFRPTGILRGIPPARAHFIRSMRLEEEGPSSSFQRRSHSKHLAQKSARSIPLKIDINRASAEELKKLPGIGPKLAQRIVNFRSQNPPFRKVEEMLIIKGINRRLLTRIRPYIIVE